VTVTLPAPTFDSAASAVWNAAAVPGSVCELVVCVPAAVVTDRVTAVAPLAVSVLPVQFVGSNRTLESAGSGVFTGAKYSAAGPTRTLLVLYGGAVGAVMPRTPSGERSRGYLPRQ
jgi:hypothetical protein